MSTTPAAEAVPRFSGRWFQEIAIRYSMVIVMLIIIGFFMFQSDRFMTTNNLTNILVAAAPFALIAIGQTLVILTGGIDLSVGSVIAVSAMAGAYVARANPDQVWLALVVAMGVGALAGAINGVVVSVINVPPFIATLGMLTLASGMAYVIGGGAPINGVPSDYGNFANTQILGLTIPVFLMLIGIIGFGLMMRRTSFGLRIYAVGGNKLAAEIAGVKTKRITFAVYVISGTLAGISGLMLSSRVISGSPSLGQSYELDAIAAVVIGGASLMGGRGSIWGTALGLFLIQTLNNGLDIMTVPSYWQDVVKGLLIVAAVAVDVWATKRRR